MLNLLPSVLLLGLCLAVLIVVRRGVLSLRRSDLAVAAAQGSAADAVVARKLLRALRARNLAAIGVAGLGAAVAILLHSLYPRVHGLSLVSAPAAMAVLVAALYALWPIPSEFKGSNPPALESISANLTPRSTGMFGPAWGVAVPGVLSGALISGLVVAGIFSGPDETGQYRNLPHVSWGGAVLDENMVVTRLELTEGSAGPFPGWYYGIPVIALLVLAGVFMLWALNSNARRATLRSPGLQDLDHAVRNHLGYILSTGISMLLCFQAVPLLGMASSSIYSAGVGSSYEVGMVVGDGPGPVLDVDPAHAAFSITLAIAALLLAITGAALLVKLTGWVGSTLWPVGWKARKVAAS